MLTGDTAHYYTLREAVGKLDNWAHLAEVSHYRKLEDDIVTAQTQINSLQADIKGWTQAKELCEGRLVGLAPMASSPILKDNKHITLD